MIGIMGKRREARERAVQFLFQHDLNPPEDLELELAQFWDSQRAAAIEDEKGAGELGREAWNCRRRPPRRRRRGCLPNR